MLSRQLSMEFRPMMPKDLKDLLRAFNDHAVKYIIVGGYAFGVHAEPRATKDMALLIRSDEENSKAVFRALAQYGAALDGVSPADFMDGSTFQIGQPPARIDILQRIDGVTFDEAWKNRIEGHIDDEIRASVISREDLIRNKLASGREQDILDAKKLRAANPSNPAQE
jgi:hypothetical protein